MPFRYRAVDLAGRRFSGVDDAAHLEAARRALGARGLLILDLRETVRPTGRQRFGPASRHLALDITRAISAMLSAGLPLGRALQDAARMVSPAAVPSLDAIRNRVERGVSLHVALSAYPRLFSPADIGIVRAGEASGGLTEAMRRLLSQQEHDAAVRGQLVSLAIYPAILTVAGTTAMAVLLLVVLPRFAELLSDVGAQLPPSTRLLLGASAFVRGHALGLIAVMLTFGMLGVAAARAPAARRRFHELLLQVPLIGEMRRDTIGARTARLLGVLLSGGAPLLSALDDTIRCVTDPVAREDLTCARRQVRDGLSLTRALAGQATVPPLLVSLGALGEETGRMADFLLKAADLLDAQVQRKLGRLMTLLEPLLIVGFGGVVGFVALSLFQAIYSVNASSFR